MILKIKKTTFYYFTVLSFIFLILAGSSRGPATNYNYDCTGAESGSARIGCTCHSATASVGINLTIELDSAGVTTSHYVGGKTYTVKLKGVNNTMEVLSAFGFQLCSIKGSVAKAAPTSAGTWKSPYPANTQYVAPSGSRTLGIMEHSSTIAATSGVGGNGTTYSESFTWTAPASGTGVISIWAALNAVNGNGYSDFYDYWNLNHVVINEWPLNTGIPYGQQNEISINIYPNPATDYAIIDFLSDKAENITAEIYDLSGKKVSNIFIVNGSGQHRELVNLASLNLTAGVYMITFSSNSGRATRKLIVN